MKVRGPRNSRIFICFFFATGYGGGYNDRGVVEYKEPVNDSDDEFDVFGRRKKKKDENLRSGTSKWDPFCFFYQSSQFFIFISILSLQK